VSGAADGSACKAITIVDGITAECEHGFGAPTAVQAGAARCVAPMRQRVRQIDEVYFKSKLGPRIERSVLLKTSSRRKLARALQASLPQIPVRRCHQRGRRREGTRVSPSTVPP
jgi:hypothetical protein